MFEMMEKKRTFISCSKQHYNAFEIFDFCPMCGEKLEPKEIIEEILCCTSCASPVNNTWEYCPYCGEERGWQ